MGKTEELINALGDSNSVARARAAKELGELRDTRAVLPLIELLKDDIFKVRMEAVKALEEIPDNRAVEPLIEMLENDFLEFKVEAAIALGRIGDNRAIGPLIRTIKGADSARSLRPRTFIIRNGIPIDSWAKYDFEVASTRSLLCSSVREAIQKISSELKDGH